MAWGDVPPYGEGTEACQELRPREKAGWRKRDHRGERYWEGERRTRHRCTPEPRQRKGTAHVWHVSASMDARELMSTTIFQRVSGAIGGSGGTSLSLAPPHSPRARWPHPSRSIDHHRQERYQPAPSRLPVGHAYANRRSTGAHSQRAHAQDDTAEGVRQQGTDNFACKIKRFGICSDLNMLGQSTQWERRGAI
jgi:hypothetical protein